MNKEIGKYYQKPQVAVARKPLATKTTGRSKLLKSLVKVNNQTFTENGAPALKSTTNKVLDLFATGGALRGKSEQDIVTLFIKAYSEDSLLALKNLFYIRDCRGGQGERETFRTIFRWLGQNYPEVAAKNIYNVIEFGRVDDLFCLIDTAAEGSAFSLIGTMLDQDVENLRENKPITLLGKWLASENASSPKTKAVARKIMRALGYGPRQYRHTLSALREKLNVVERKMSAGDWSGIDYSHVPSKASMNYRNAFLRNDKERYSAFLLAVAKGENKINAATLFPYEIIQKLECAPRDQTLDVLWDALPNYLEDKARNILCVCDVSGSMSGIPMWTSIGIGIYLAERNTGKFGGHFITYSQKPQLQEVVGKTIAEKYRCLTKLRSVNTNLQAVFDMLLENAIGVNATQEDMPEQILIISDMQFDSPQNGEKPNFETIKEKYALAGYDMPHLVYWNCRATSTTFEVEKSQRGVSFVSGHSPSIFRSLLSSKEHTPVDQMLESLNSPRYESVVI